MLLRRLLRKITQVGIAAIVLATGILVAVPVSPVYAATLDLQVSESTDDANYYKSIGTWTYSGTLQYGYTGKYDANNAAQGNGMVFDGVTIPQGATIDSAYIEVKCYQSYGTAVKSKIYGYDADTAGTFANETDYKNRFGVNGGTDARTTANIDWNDMAAWSVGQWYQSPDIKTIIQEIINRAGWSSGNGISLVWDDYAEASANGNARYIYSYNTGAASAPKLHIEYTTNALGTTTVAASNIGVVSAQLNGTLDDLNGEASADCYFEWDTDTGEPYANSTIATADTLTGTGAFNETITGFVAGDTIYYRAVANNGVDTAYGVEDDFTLNNYLIDYYGDSITVGTGASIPANSWQELVEAATGYSENNEAVGATKLSGQYTQFTQNTVTNDSISMALLGYNDMRYFGTNTAALTGYGYAVRSALAHAALPSSGIYEADNVAITYTGSWGIATPYSGINTKYSNTNGSTASFTVTGHTVYVDTLQYGTSTTALQVSIDGNNLGTFSNSAYPDGYAPRLLRFAGLTNTSHSVVCTVVTGTGYTYINWVGASDGTPDGGTVYIGGSLKMESYGGFAPYNQGSDSAVAQYNAVIAAAASELASDGLDVIYVDVNAYFVVGTDFAGGDGVHPNDTGHDHIADAFLAAFNSGPSSLPVVVTGSPAQVTQTTAVLQGSLTDIAGYTTVYIDFEHGLTTAYGSATAEQAATANGSFSASLTGLAPNTAYHFRIRVRYGTGSYVNGNDVVFTTLSASQPSGDMNIISVNVFSDYLIDGDLLVAIEYVNNVPPYAGQTDAKSYFLTQFLGLDGATVIAANPLPDWGNRPTSIYLGTSITSSITEGGAYVVKMVGTYTDAPASTYTLTPSDWRGKNKRYLDTWLLNTAWDMSRYYQLTASNQYVTVTPTKEVISTEGSNYFIRTIPYINYVRPAMFETGGVSAKKIADATSDYNDQKAYETQVGPVISSMMTDFGALIGQEGRDFNGFLFGIAFILIFAVVTVISRSAGGGLIVSSVVMALGVLLYAVGIQVLFAISFMLLMVGLFVWLSRSGD